jgi:type IV fimbrial biogenesis protein FimT
MRISHAHHLRRNGGFSMIELMTVLVIAAIFTVVAIPTFQETIRSNRVATQANEMMTSFTLARSEAIRRNGRVSICAQDPSTSTPTCGTDWAGGVVVFADDDGDGTMDGGETIIRFYDAPSDWITISGTPADRDVITFNRRGLTTLAAGQSLALLLSPDDECLAGRPLVRNFNLDATGRMRVNKSNCP